MEIPRDLRPADPVARRRVQGAGEHTGKGDGPPAATASGASDRAALAGGNEVQRFVQVLKGSDPARLHRVEDLRARIADGSYSADSEELADLILGGGSGPEARSTPPGRSR